MHTQTVSLFSWGSQLSSIWIPGAYLILLLIISPYHSVFNEWGGVMQYFSGKEILSRKGYNGWTARFWPPLFSLLIGLLSKLFSGFTAGKLVSIVSSSLLLYVAYSLAFELTGSIEIGFLTQVFLALSPMYFKESLQAHNHMLDALLFVLGLTLLFKSFGYSTHIGFISAGLICGLAGLARYTSNILFALPFSLFFIFIPTQASKFAIAFWLGFLIISLPWWVYNLRKHGSPIYAWQHLNACTAVFPGQTQSTLSSLWWCAGNSDINSIADVFMAYPKKYIKNFVKNIFHSLVLLSKYGGVLAIFVIPGIFESIFYIKPEYWIILYGLLSLNIIFASQIFVVDWLYTGWSVPIVIVSTMFILSYLERIIREFPFLNIYQFRTSSIALIILIGLVLIVLQLRTYIIERNRGALQDLDQVTQALIEHDPHLESKVIMAVDPARAYYAKAKYLNTPLYYDGSIEGLVSYAGICDKVKEYAPKYPSNMKIIDLHADYLISTRLPEDFVTDNMPENFKSIYRSDEVEIYEITWD